jgi:F1F0 ATPase subunit 2
MNIVILTALALLAGISIAIVFFAGLWWTVRKATSSRQPGILFAGSFMLRTALALSGFYLVGSGSFSRLTACLAGFIVGRMLVKGIFNQEHLAIEVQPLNGGTR